LYNNGLSWVGLTFGLFLCVAIYLQEDAKKLDRGAKNKYVVWSV